MRKKWKCCCTVGMILITALLVLSGCSANHQEQNGNLKEAVVSETPGYQEDTDTSDERITPEYNSDDTDSSWSKESAVYIACEGTKAVIEGNGAKWNNGSVVITKQGTYVLSGTLDDGQIIVETGNNDLVHIVLNGIDVTCSDNAAFYGIQSDKVVLTMEKGTTNTFSDGTNYALEDSTADEPNAAVFSKDDLSINGEGELIVKGNYYHGIYTKDSLIIASGILDITSVNDGLKGKDNVVVLDGTINIQAEGDGIQSNNATDAGRGYVALLGGSYNIEAGMDGVQAETVLEVTAGTYNITTGGGSQNANNKTDTNTQEETVSVKGMKAGTAVYIEGGTFTIDSKDDSLHSNGSVTISSGDLMLSSGDDGIHGDSFLNITGGNITVTKSYEGLEGKSIDIKDGTIHVTSSDDGLNAAGGSDQSAVRGGPGEDQFSSSGDAYIKISGGYVYVNADGDGLDVNGSLYVDGGVVLVDGPENGGNGAFDYDGDAVITGGIVLAAGSSGMATTFSASSTQNSVLYYFTSQQEAGTLVTLTDDEGNNIMNYAPSKKYQSIVISMPELEQNKTYHVFTGGTVAGEGMDGYYPKGTNSSGTERSSFTLSEVSSQIAENGEVPSAGMGNMQHGRGNKGQPGGSRQRPQMQEGTLLPDGQTPLPMPDGETPLHPDGQNPPDNQNPSDNQEPSDIPDEQNQVNL